MLWLTQLHKKSELSKRWVTYFSQTAPQWCTSHWLIVSPSWNKLLWKNPLERESKDMRLQIYRSSPLRSLFAVWTLPPIPQTHIPGEKCCRQTSPRPESSAAETEMKGCSLALWISIRVGRQLNGSRYLATLLEVVKICWDYTHTSQCLPAFNANDVISWHNIHPALQLIVKAARKPQLETLRSFLMSFFFLFHFKLPNCWFCSNQALVFSGSVM